MKIIGNEILWNQRKKEHTLASPNKPGVTSPHGTHMVGPILEPLVHKVSQLVTVWQSD
ncbi:hypothetical protein CHS0354_033813, partial [Potamilus streckersoni]